MDTSRLDGVKAPLHFKTPRSHHVLEIDDEKFQKFRLRDDGDVRNKDHIESTKLAEGLALR